MANKNVLFLGLPGSGKTSFIAALWYFIFQSKSNNSLVLDSIIGENEYLSEITKEWLSFNPVSRTRLTSKGEQVIMKVKEIQNGLIHQLEIPDFSGETFREQFDNREWSKDFSNLLDDVEGIVLFINPNDEKNMPKFIIDLLKFQRFLGAVPPDKDKDSKAVPYDPAHTPNQVKLVDFFQFLDYYKSRGTRIKLSLVISKYDTLLIEDEPYPDPEIWIKNHLPLLHQYLICNHNKYDLRCFGISAQGGDYATEVNRLAEIDPSERIRVFSDSGESSDIALPILWSLA